MKSLAHPFAIWGFGIIGLVGTLYLATTYQSFLIPLIIAIFFALLLLPGVSLLEKLHVPKILAHVIMIALLLLGIILALVVFSFALSDFAGSLYAYQGIMFENISWLEQKLGAIMQTDIVLAPALVSTLVSWEFILKNISTVLFEAGKWSIVTSIIVIYTFFLLYYRNHIKKFIYGLAGNEKIDSIKNITSKIERVIPRYLVGLIIANTLMAIITWAGLALVGVHNALFWGIIIGILNTVPFLGPLVGFFALMIMVFLTQGIPVLIGAFIIFAVAQFIDNAVLAPYIAGGSINLNPLVAIIGLVAMKSIWGITGMILAIPLLGVIKILCDNFIQTRPLGTFLGDEAETPLWVRRIIPFNLKN